MNGEFKLQQKFSTPLSTPISHKQTTIFKNEQKTSTNIFSLDISAHCFIHLLSFVTDTSQGKNLAMLLLLGNQQVYCSVDITLKSQEVSPQKLYESLI